jgi:hypothetical protein
VIRRSQALGPFWSRRPEAAGPHRFKLDQIEAAHDLFGHQRDGVLKVAITP